MSQEESLLNSDKQDKEHQVHDTSQNVTRREFLARAAGAGLALGSAGLLNIPAVFAASTRPKTGMVYRVLGRTKQKISVVSLGTVQIKNPAVIHRALDYGINYLDTAECYSGGEQMIGEVLKSRPNDAFVCTKWHTDGVNTTKQQLIESAEGSLKRLGVNTIDMIATHSAETIDQVKHEVVYEAFKELKKAGKIRYLGFSHHGMDTTLIRRGIKTGWYDAIFIAYNFMAPADVRAVVAEAKKAGIGIVTMKSVFPASDPKAGEFFGTISTSPQVAAIKWVLNDPNVSTCNAGMTTFEQIDEDLKAVGKPLRKAEAEALQDFASAVDSTQCRLCGVCSAKCPQGVAVADIMRCTIYHDYHKDLSLAVRTYNSLPKEKQLITCTRCGTCNAVCPYGLAVTQHLEQAAVYLS